MGLAGSRKGGRTLGKVKEYAHEALAVHLDVDVADVRGHLVFRKPQLPAPVLEAIEEAEATRPGAVARRR